MYTFISYVHVLMRRLNSQTPQASTEPLMVLSGSNMCVLTCTYPVVHVKSSGQLWWPQTLRLSAVLCGDHLSKAQGHWGQWSHLGQGIVHLETCHAENKQTILKLYCAMSTRPVITIPPHKILLWACNASEILLPRPCICAFSA